MRKAEAAKKEESEIKKEMTRIRKEMEEDRKGHEEQKLKVHVAPASRRRNTKT